MCLKYPVYLLYIIAFIWLLCLGEGGILLGSFFVAAFGEGILIPSILQINRCCLSEKDSSLAHFCLYSVLLYGTIGVLYYCTFYYLDAHVRYPVILYIGTFAIQISINAYYQARNLTFEAHPGEWGGVTQYVDTLPCPIKSFFHVATSLITISPFVTIILLIVNFLIS